jgi:hypothetical protein
MCVVKVILARRQIETPSEPRDQLIERADGFAQVLPADKQVRTQTLKPAL